MTQPRLDLTHKPHLASVFDQVNSRGVVHRITHHRSKYIEFSVCELMRKSLLDGEGCRLPHSRSTCQKHSLARPSKHVQVENEHDKKYEIGWKSSSTLIYRVSLAIFPHGNYQRLSLIISMAQEVISSMS